jgi:hypothetical protein
MMLGYLELFVWVQRGIFVVKTDHHADVYLILPHVVKKRASICMDVEWPSHGMLH